MLGRFYSAPRLRVPYGVHYSVYESGKCYKLHQVYLTEYFTLHYYLNQATNQLQVELI